MPRGRAQRRRFDRSSWRPPPGACPCSAVRGGCRRVEYSGSLSPSQGFSGAMCMPSEIFQLASRYVDELAALDPFSATAMGVPGHEHEVSDYSPATQQHRAEHARRALDTLQHAGSTNRDDEI